MGWQILHGEIQISYIYEEDNRLEDEHAANVKSVHNLL